MVGDVAHVDEGVQMRDGNETMIDWGSRTRAVSRIDRFSLGPIGGF